jgi:hypothetical protein
MSNVCLRITLYRKLTMETHVQTTNREAKNMLGNDVLGDIRSLNVKNWGKVAKDRDRWKVVFERA